MSKTPKPSVESRIVSRLKGFTKSLREGGEIDARFTSRKVVLNLQTAKFDSDLVKETRQTLGASQSIFAQFMGVSTATVQAWEQDDNQPSALACRFMDEIRGNPDYWQERFLALVEPKEVV